MASETLAFRRRLITNCVLTTLLIVVLVILYRLLEPYLPNNAFVTGWLLLGVMLFLTLYNMRKRVPFLRLGNSQQWLQLHIYVGVFSAALFFVHIGFSWPDGIFRQVFAWCYVGVFLTGVLGIWMSRAIPRKLTANGAETPYEYISHVRGKLREDAEKLVTLESGDKPSATLAEFYTEHLSEFFSGPRNFLRHIRQSRSGIAEHELQFSEIRRYLKSDEKSKLEKLHELVLRKHALDYQYALQTSLRIWLFAHIPLTYSLLVFTVLHIFLVYAFSSAVT